MEALAAATPAAATLLAVGACVFAAAVLRGITGFGFALAAVPLMGLVVPPAQAVVVAVLLQSMIGLQDIRAMRSVVDWRSVLRLGAGALAGTPPRIALLTQLDPAATRLALAGLVAGGLVFLLRTPASGTVGVRPFEAPLAGLLAGFFGGLAAMPGPPAVAYFLRAGSSPPVARASLMIFFFITSLIALPGLAATGLLDLPALLIAVPALPLLMIGASLGAAIFLRTSEAGYRRLALIVLAVIAAASGVRGVAGLLQ